MLLFCKRLIATVFGFRLFKRTAFINRFLPDLLGTGYIYVLICTPIYSCREIVMTMVASLLQKHMIILIAILTLLHCLWGVTISESCINEAFVLMLLLFMNTHTHTHTNTPILVVSKSIIAYIESKAPWTVDQLSQHRYLPRRITDRSFFDVTVWYARCPLCPWCLRWKPKTNWPAASIAMGKLEL